MGIGSKTVATILKHRVEVREHSYWEVIAAFNVANAAQYYAGLCREKNYARGFQYRVSELRGNRWVVET